ncbi:MAG: HD domain-containing protein [Actinomycetota bacterium]
MTIPQSVDELLALYVVKGNEHYGENVTQLEHGLQCAALAATEGAPEPLIAAALLHDVGHLVADVQGDERFDLETDDDHHEAVGARVLSRVFGPLVAQSVALHVTAKRWRCTIEPDYLQSLSPTSTATLKAQGGLLDADACARFEAHPGFGDALALRRWDDTGKVIDLVVEPLESYRPLLERLAVDQTFS